MDWQTGLNAPEGRYGEAADTLLAIPLDQNRTPRQSIEDAARLLRTAPAKARAPETLPALFNELSWVYAHVGAQDRILEISERDVEPESPNLGIGALWEPLAAPLRKTERFKERVRNAGFVDYWRQRGWPDLCRPLGADDFVCD